ncbi:MAG: glycosyltransferase [candidate division KSB1 bacterium]|nr:glycosyltransferase [candidate division KSB1 bacterium]MDZ7272773.1 glycosyltransferase [candidate division KSB1 bacterium]MDZ7284203.1 glycosyltransferase [candidate division KSB1 bacterium]MDZ7297399.1 glycosyltransferase [candidate division KSB1 bacterium]MDZ7306541.1 glycosyltransferase [candidate division KSB1 bacterium]
MATTNKHKLLFVSWAENCSRSDNLARLLGGSSRMIYAGRLGSNYFTVTLKYLVQMWMTWRLLRHERPRVVLVMVPPVFICVPVYLYCRLTGAGYLTDTHTAAFTMARWKPLLFLNAWFYRRALGNIVTNEHLARQVEKWRAPVVVIGDLPVQFPRIAEFPLNGRFAVAVVCSYNPDEPLDHIWEAARQLPEVDFYVTGKVKDAPARLLDHKPDNMNLTDFLPLEQYAGLIKGCHAVMVLTTRDHTMQRGAYEALALGTPIITSDWPLLRETFDQAALYVDNSPAGIVAGVRRLQAAWPEYKAAVQRQREQRLQIWREREARLRAAINTKLAT